MLGVDPELGTSALRLWVAAGSAALLVVVCVLAFARSRTTAAASGLRSGVVVLGAILGAAMAWAFFDHASVRDQAAERWALEIRAEDLTTRALAPGSPLACLDALAGEIVGAACEKAIFAAPATVATAISYVAERFKLLSDMVAYAGHGGGADIESTVLPLRRSLEADRFGFLAHALAMRDGCTGESCKALALLRDPTRVRANLSGATLNRYLEHYQTVWAQTPEVPVADANSAQPSALTLSGPQGQRKVSVNIDFPTAASIPAVSIMNPEPKGPPAAAAAAASSGNTNTPAAAAPSSRKPRKQGANPPAQVGAQSAPSPAAAEAQVEPVWTPAPVAPLSQAAATPGAPAANPGSGGTGPMQLSPFASAPDANAGMTMRTQ
jgi:hypothetical protein